jgi:hypothetical protein
MIHTWVIFRTRGELGGNNGSSARVVAWSCSTRRKGNSGVVLGVWHRETATTKQVADDDVLPLRVVWNNRYYDTPC